jgi:protein-tyrosine-phosphatase
MTSVAAPAAVPPMRSWAVRLVGAALKHPAIATLKPSIRNAVWSIRGAGTANPELPSRVDSLLFICLGNICRSPFAAHLAARLLAEAGHDGIRCSSAGLRPSQAARSTPEACVAASHYGLSLEQHAPQPVTRDLLASHDVVCVMEWRQLVQLQAAYPAFRHRMFLLSLLDTDAGGAYERYNIADPFGGTLSSYEACYSRIDRALRRMLARLPS